MKERSCFHPPLSGVEEGAHCEKPVSVVALLSLELLHDAVFQLGGVAIAQEFTVS